MKKLLYLVLVIVLYSTSVYAEDSTTSNSPMDISVSFGSKAKFNNSTNNGLTDIERGKERVKDISPLIKGEGLSDRQLALIGRSDSASVTNGYYVENVEITDGGDVESNMVSVSESDYYKELKTHSSKNPINDKRINNDYPEDTEVSDGRIIIEDDFQIVGGLLRVALMMCYSINNMLT